MVRMTGQRNAPAISALPPSMAVVCRVRHDCMDAGDRATQDAVAEDAGSDDD
jgi:hypothetical protein